MAHVLTGELRSPFFQSAAYHPARSFGGGLGMESFRAERLAEGARESAKTCRVCRPSREMMFRIASLAASILLACPASGRDLGQWSNVDPKLSAWFRALAEPDDPSQSCCGKADAYWCDIVHVQHGKVFCTITDRRDDKPLGRPHVPVGTVIEIPPNKVQASHGNPSGHTIVFMSEAHWVYCFVPDGGV